MARCKFTKICEHCKREYHPHVYKQRFCSDVCAIPHRAQCQKKIRPTSTCEKCGQTFTVPRSDSTGRFCSRKCSYAGQRVPPAIKASKTCPHCHKPFSTRPRTDGLEIEYCSVKCAKRHKALTMVGSNHPLWKPKITKACEVCGAIVTLYPSKAKRFRACSRRCACILGLQTWPRTSSIEVKMAEAFKAIGLEPQPQFTFGQFITDFAFPESRLIVECDGVYWHGRPEQQIKDQRKDAYLTRHKWLVVRLGESEINTSPADCASRVANLLQDRPPIG